MTSTKYISNEVKSDTFPTIEYDINKPYTTIANYWLNEILYRNYNVNRSSINQRQTRTVQVNKNNLHLN